MRYAHRPSELLPPFQNIRCFSLSLPHMYLDAFYYIGSLLLLLTYTLKDVYIHANDGLKHLIFWNGGSSNLSS
jgi:hypothetical protein